MSEEPSYMQAYNAMCIKIERLTGNDDLKVILDELPSVERMDKICLITDQFANLSKIYWKHKEGSSA